MTPPAWRRCPHCGQYCTANATCGCDRVGRPGRTTPPLWLLTAAWLLVGLAALWVFGWW